MSQDTGFRFLSARNLQMNLGRIDATVECTELAVREFISNSMADDSPETYIEGLSERHGIRVNSVDFNLLKVRVSQLYIISVYEQAEGFLEDFRAEHPRSLMWKYEENDDLFKRVLKNVGSDFNQAKQAVGTLEVNLFDYYRKVRNRFVHPEIDESKNDNKVPELKTQVKLNPNYQKLNAPNVYEKICFDDFILFTRILKHISKSLCIASKPNDKEISDAAKKLLESGKSTLKLQKLKGLKNNPKRARNSVESFLRELYGLNREESAPIIEILLNDLLA